MRPVPLDAHLTLLDSGFDRRIPLPHDTREIHNGIPGANASDSISSGESESVSGGLSLPSRLQGSVPQPTHKQMQGMREANMIGPELLAAIFLQGSHGSTPKALGGGNVGERGRRRNWTTCFGKATCLGIHSTCAHTHAHTHMYTYMSLKHEPLHHSYTVRR